MKNKGFTLIELLAVIVILAIIALIATPVILNIINSSREQANVRSAELYESAVRLALARSQVNQESIKDGYYYITDNGNLKNAFINSNDVIEVDVDKSRPTSGIYYIVNGDIKSVTGLTMGGKVISKNDNGKYEVSSSTAINFSNQTAMKYQQNGTDYYRLRIFSLAKVTGAAIKEDSNYALDYTNIKVTIDNKEYKVFEIGTLVAIGASRKDLLYFTDKSTTPDSNVKRVPAENVYYVFDQGVVFNASVTSIPISAYEKSICAKGYIGYEDENQEAKYIYSDAIETSVKKASES